MLSIAFGARLPSVSAGARSTFGLIGVEGAVGSLATLVPAAFVAVVVKV